MRAVNVGSPVLLIAALRARPETENLPVGQVTTIMVPPLFSTL
jgi:hypothetical protein